MAERRDDQMVVQLTVGELKLLVADAAREAVAEHLRPAHQWVDVSAAAEHFGCSGQTIRNWIKRGCPARQLGERGEFRLRLDEVEGWLDTQKPGKLTAVR